MAILSTDISAMKVSNTLSTTGNVCFFASYISKRRVGRGRSFPRYFSRMLLLILPTSERQKAVSAQLTLLCCQERESNEIFSMGGQGDEC